MNEITLSFTPEELLVLGKHLYMASYFMITYDDYENEEIARGIMTKVCAAGFAQANEEGHYRYGGPTETAFTISLEASEECEPLVESFQDDAVMEYLPYALADRDFIEKYGKMDPIDVVNNTSLREELENMQTEYKHEILFNGVENLRLIKKNS